MAEERLKSLKDDLEEFNSLIESGVYNCVPTGIEPLDEMLDGGLTPGQFYVIGGGPGCGKTTLVSQIADYVAESGRRVIYFDFIYTARTKHVSEKEIIATGSKYVSELSDFVWNHCPDKKTSPLIVIDSIQQIEPERELTYEADSRNTICRINSLARNLTAPVLAVSETNRHDYNTHITSLSFKGDDAIVNVPDVLISLEPASLGHKAGVGFENYVDIKLIKNRNGVDGVVKRLFFDKKSGQFI